MIICRRYFLQINYDLLCLVCCTVHCTLTFRPSPLSTTDYIPFFFHPINHFILININFQFAFFEFLISQNKHFSTRTLLSINSLFSILLLLPIYSLTLLLFVKNSNKLIAKKRTSLSDFSKVIYRQRSFSYDLF